MKHNKMQTARAANSHGFEHWIAEHPIARHCLIGALLLVLISLNGCGRTPIVRTETVEIKVPVKPDIPAEVLQECVVDFPRPASPTIGDLADLAERQRIELKRCSEHKAAMREAIEKIPVAPK